MSNKSHVSQIEESVVLSQEKIQKYLLQNKVNDLQEKLVIQEQTYQVQLINKNIRINEVSQMLRETEDDMIEKTGKKMIIEEEEETMQKCSLEILTEVEQSKEI